MKGRFHQTFFSKQKDAGAQRLVKNCRSISPTNKGLNLSENSPKLFAVCQTLCAQIPSYSVCAKNSDKMLLKSAFYFFSMVVHE
jgi:hypothetical protein